MSRNEKAPATASNGDGDIELQKVYAGVNDFFGKLGLSVVMQLPITTAINLGAAKVGGTSYAEAWSSFKKLPVASILDQGSKTIKRRTLSSIAPSAVTNAIGSQYQLPSYAIVGVNTALESFVAGFVTKEANERFHAVQSKQFPIVSEKGVGIDLTTITKKDFAAHYYKHGLAAEQTEAKWSALQKAVTNYNQNLSWQATFLGLRNSLFSAAIFAARPLAKDFIAAHKKEIEATGIAPERAEEVLTYSIRGAFAWMTAPFDRIFTMLSSGNMTAEEVSQSFMRDIKSRDFSRFFAGATARTALCLITASTIAEGPKFGEFIKSATSELFDIDPNRRAIGADLESKIPSQVDLLKDATSAIGAPEKERLASEMSRELFPNDPITAEEITSSLECSARLFKNLTHEMEGAGHNAAPNAEVSYPKASPTLGQKSPPSRHT